MGAGEAPTECLSRFLHSPDVCDHHQDVATASLIEAWIDETERRTWFLSQTLRRS